MDLIITVSLGQYSFPSHPVYLLMCVLYVDMILSFQCFTFTKVLVKGFFFSLCVLKLLCCLALKTGRRCELFFKSYKRSILFLGHKNDLLPHRSLSNLGYIVSKSTVPAGICLYEGMKCLNGRNRDETPAVLRWQRTLVSARELGPYSESIPWPGAARVDGVPYITFPLLAGSGGRRY